MRRSLQSRDSNGGFYLPFRHTDPLGGVDREYDRCGEPVCKPGSVRAPQAGCVATIHLRHASPRASSGLPADSGEPPSDICAGRTLSGPSRPCSGWGLPSRPRHRGRWCALTAPFHPYRHGPFGSGGGLFSVALSRGSPRVGVTNHPALWSPDFPRTRRSPGRLAAARPTRRVGKCNVRGGGLAHGGSVRRGGTCRLHYPRSRPGRSRGADPGRSCMTAHW
jgi:hypothetical protein